VRIIFKIIFLFLILQVSAQKIQVKTVAKLPKQLWESSGLVSGVNNSVWTHNDSGGQAVLYKLDSVGSIVRQVHISGVENADWEDLANDYNGFVYIADIGNNCNCRKNLKIYKIPHPDSLNVDSIAPTIISYSYEDQKEFPPKESQLNFDAESLIAYNDSIFIFTKNWTKPYSKYTYVYALPNVVGEHIATLKDSIYLKRTHRYKSWITSASRHPNKDLVVLLSHKKAWLISNFRLRNKFDVRRTKVTGIYSQKEAIAFDMNGNIWISNEKFKFLKSKLKKGSLK